jgi:tripartite-type tricarboxylate transporter receptor subunit TctC
MKMSRRSMLHLAVGAAAGLAPARVAPVAQSYPARPVRLIVPFGTAGATDIVARLIGQFLSERLGQPFVIENRPGAGSNLGIEAVVRAPADGYTLLLVGTPAAVNASLYDKLSYNFIRDIAPVAAIIRFPNVMLVNPSVPARTIPEFIAYAKAHPAKLNIASPGAGSAPHLAGELFKMMAGVDMVHVPYRSTAGVMTDLLSGQVQVFFATTASSSEYIRAGSVRALAVTTAMRSDVLPDIPTVAEFVSGYESSPWFGIGVPRNTPAAVVDRLNTGINALLAEPMVKTKFTDLGGTALPGAPADFARLIAEETEKWAKVVKFSGMKAE